MTVRFPTAGAAAEYLAGRFGGLFTERESNPSIGVGASSAVGNNPDRLALLFVNLSANTITLGLQQGSVSSTNGISIGPNGGSASLVVEEDFTLTTREWFAVAGGAASSLYVLEMIRYQTTAPRS